MSSSRDFLARTPSPTLHALRPPLDSASFGVSNAAAPPRPRGANAPNPVEAINACAATTRSVLGSSHHHTSSPPHPRPRASVPPLTPHHTLKPRDAARVIHPRSTKTFDFPDISASRPRVHSTHVAERSNRRRRRRRRARDRGYGRVGGHAAHARPSSSITVIAMGVIVTVRRRRRARARREGDEERARETDDDDASSASTRDGRRGRSNQHGRRVRMRSETHETPAICAGNGRRETRRGEVPGMGRRA